MKRIALIESGVTQPKRFVYHISPPHGLMYLAAYLRSQRPKLEIKIFDLTVKKGPESIILPELQDFAPDLVGIHAMHFQARYTHRLARMVKEQLGIPVVVGGPYPHSEPEAALSDPNIDVAVRGEGELTLVELIERLEQGRDFAGVAGVSHRTNGQVVHEPERAPIPDLDQLPLPAWDLIELDKYFEWFAPNLNEIRWHKRAAAILTSRACPYGCIYCHNLFGKRFRARSPEHVLSELRLLYERYGVREFHLIDDCFNFDLERAKQICRLILASGMRVKLGFPNGLRGDRLDRELVDLLKAAGTYKVHVGIESGSEREQKLIHKKLDLAKLKANIELLDRVGIFVHGFFMMGFPGETEADLEATIAYAVESKLHTAGFALLTPFPGTQVREVAQQLGKPIKFDSESATYTQLTCNLTDLTDEQLLSYHRRAYWEFYFRPGQLLRIYRATPRKWILPLIFWVHFRTKFR